jgi:hypothetical protein
VSLAALQEEVLELGRPPPRRGEFMQFPPRPIPRTALPLPPPPGVHHRPGVPAPTPVPPPPDGARPTSMDEKPRSMRAYRRAHGLCYVCGKKWNPSHSCAPTVQLHVVEELLDLLQASSEDEVTSNVANLCVISREAMDGSEAPHTLRLHGQV